MGCGPVGSSRDNPGRADGVSHALHDLEAGHVRGKVVVVVA
jgi:hypothetical protein